MAAAELSQGDTPLNDKMRGLVARMENITKQLKFFSGKGRDQFETLDLREIVSAAHELLEPNIQEIDANVDISRPTQRFC